MLGHLPANGVQYMSAVLVLHMVDGKRYTQSCPMGDIEPELNPDMFSAFTVLSSLTFAALICTIMGMSFWRMDL